MKVALVCCPIWSSGSPPLSLAVLQARLKLEKHNITVHDFSAQTFNNHKFLYNYLRLVSYVFVQRRARIFGKLLVFLRFLLNKQAKEILRTAPEFICFSVYKSNLLSTFYIAGVIRKLNPAVKIAFGGPACYLQSFRSLLSENGDYVISMEGDLVISEIIRNIEEPGYKINERILNDLDREPLPDFSGFDMEKYKDKALPYSSTRGCYNRCAYCLDARFWKRYRTKSAEKVFKDLKRLHELYGINNFHFSDSVMMKGRMNLEKLCDLLIQSELRIRWSWQVRSTMLDEDIIAKMKKAGCAKISIGIESGSQRILDLMKKGYNITREEKAIRALSKAGIEVTTMYMVGYPTETWSDFMKTARFVYNNRKYMSRMHVSMTSIIEGTELYATAEELGVRRKDSFIWYHKGNNFITRLTRLALLKSVGMVRVG